MTLTGEKKKKLFSKNDHHTDLALNVLQSEQPLTTLLRDFHHMGPRKGDNISTPNALLTALQQHLKIQDPPDCQIRGDTVSFLALFH